MAKTESSAPSGTLSSLSSPTNQNQEAKNNQTNSFFDIPTLIKCFRELDRRGLIHQTYKSIDYVDDLVKSKLNSYINSESIYDTIKKFY